jgi:hypothetical protein
VYFELSGSQATAASTALGVKRQDRHPIGERVTGTFAPTKPIYEKDEPVEVVLTLANPTDAPTVLYRVGGRQRGPRDNAFFFKLTRDGREVLPIHGDDSGGISHLMAFPSGESRQTRQPLASWGDVKLPGHYVVECAYGTEMRSEALSDAGARNGDDDKRGAVWDRLFEGRVNFEVR